MMHISENMVITVMDSDQLNKIAKEIQPKANPAFTKKSKEWAKFNQYENWILDASERHSIRVIADVLICAGVDYSPSWLRKKISRLLEDNRKKINKKGNSSSSAFIETHAVNEKTNNDDRKQPEVESATSTDESLADNPGDRLKDTRPAWIIREEQKKLKKQQEEEEELRLKPWKDQSLPMEERRRLQEEYITQNVDTVFKLKK